MNNQIKANPLDVSFNHWSGVFSITLCVFILITSEFMPVSLLTPIASTLQITEGMAGQGIAISGAFAVFTSLFISVIFGNTNRKKVLLILTAIMVLSCAIVSISVNYFMYMVGRALIGIAIGGFWSMSAAVAMCLVQKKNISRALAIFNGGNALAMVIAAPMGAYLETIIGWRATFFSLIPLLMITLFWQWIALPSMPVKTNTRSVTGAFNVFKLMRRQVVIIGMLAISFLFIGQFTLFTYIRPFLEVVTQVNVPTLSYTLLVIGITGFIGTTFINIMLKWGFYTTLIVMPLLMACISVSLIIFGTKIAIVIVLLAFWGFIATSIPVGWWAWIPKTFPQEVEVGGGLMVAVIQLSIALGSTVGGILFDSSGYQITFITSAILLLIAALLAWKLSCVEEK
ncbi:Purine ribonucleoside efflux pump NepI [Candidatus Hepatincola sp. Av]